jgi:hypothetical protein
MGIILSCPVCMSPADCLGPHGIDDYNFRFFCLNCKHVWYLTAQQLAEIPMKEQRIGQEDPEPGSGPIPG